jgi:hypothetical protein
MIDGTISCASLLAHVGWRMPGIGKIADLLRNTPCGCEAMYSIDVFC